MANKTTIEPLGVDIYFFTDKEKYKKHLLKNQNHEDDLNGFDGRTLYLEDEEFNRVIYIGVFNNDVTSLAHECNHAVIFLYNVFSLDVKDSNGEHFCYMHQKLMKDCLKWLD